MNHPARSSAERRCWPSRVTVIGTSCGGRAAARARRFRCCCCSAVATSTARLAASSARWRLSTREPAVRIRRVVVANPSAADRSVSRASASAARRSGTCSCSWRRWAASCLITSPLTTRDCADRSTMSLLRRTRSSSSGSLLLTYVSRAIRRSWRRCTRTAAFATSSALRAPATTKAVDASTLAAVSWAALTRCCAAFALRSSRSARAARSWARVTPVSASRSAWRTSSADAAGCGAVGAPMSPSGGSAAPAGPTVPATVAVTSAPRRSATDIGRMRRGARLGASGSSWCWWRMGIGSFDRPAGTGSGGRKTVTAAGGRRHRARAPVTRGVQPVTAGEQRPGG